MTLDYRTPQAGTHRVQKVMQQLLRAHSLSWAGVIVKLAVGLPLCLVGPLLVTLLLGRAVKESPGLGMTFILATLVVVPLLMYLERRSRGDFLSETLTGADSSRPSSYGEWELRGHRTMWVLLTEFALYGPRMLWGVIDFFRNRTKVDAPLRMVAGRIVVQLLDQDEAMNVRELVGPATPAPMVVAALRFLQECDWVDLSRKRDRVWLRSPIRNRLANL